MTRPIYLDYNSTTPTDPAVLEAMLPYFSENFGNAASAHAIGKEARAAVEKAREQVAALIHAPAPENVIFTSGATESNNLALKGLAKMLRPKGRTIITQNTEHSSVLEPLRELTHEGFLQTELTVDETGTVDPRAVAREINYDTILVAIMAANNEIGTIQPIREIAYACHQRGALLFCDGVQAVGKIPVDVKADEIDLLSLSAHKMYGPKGIGALYIAPKAPPTRLASLLQGGGHERGLRSGTLPVPLIVGFGKACEIAARMIQEDMLRMQGLRARLYDGLCNELGDVKRNGHPENNLPGTLSVSFAGVDGEMLFQELTEVAVASGSACATAKRETSHVLRALGLSQPLARATLRFSLGRPTTEAEIDQAIRVVTNLVQKHRR